MLSRHPTTGGKQFYLGKKSRPFWEIFDGRLSYKISKKIRSGQNMNRNFWVITFTSAKLLLKIPQVWHFVTCIGRPLEDFGPSPPSPIRFSFAHGGAGFCINRGSIQQIEDNFRLVSRFQDLAFNIGLNDDVTIGYLMEILLKIELTPINDFHSHSERLGDVKKSDLSRLVCI